MQEESAPLLRILHFSGEAEATGKGWSSVNWRKPVDLLNNSVIQSIKNEKSTSKNTLISLLFQKTE